MATYYHVIRDWDGGDLKSLKQRIDEGELGLETWEEIEEYIEARWPGNSADTYLAGDGSQVHMHYTLDEAIEYRDMHCEGGIILAFDDEDDEAEEGDEYPHPVFNRPIEAHWLKVVELEAA